MTLSGLSVGRLMVKWNCLVKNKRCPIDDYDEDVELLNIYFNKTR